MFVLSNFVGWALRKGWGGVPCLISGAQMNLRVRVSSEKHEAIFLKGGLRQELGGGWPLGAHKIPKFQLILLFNCCFIFGFLGVSHLIRASLALHEDVFAGSVDFLPHDGGVTGND